MEDVARFKQQGVWPIAGNPVPYIDDIFSTNVYSGNSSTQTITNGIDLSGQGGLVWIKARNGSGLTRNNRLWTTNLTGSKTLQSDTNAAIYDYGSTQVTFNSNGFALSSDAGINATSSNYVAWNFRKKAKFFDIVTYTGTGGFQTISHNLGSAPGMIIVKRTDATGNWAVYHRSNGAGYTLYLNTTDARAGENDFQSVSSTQFVIYDDSTSWTNKNGGSYVAYLFAHDAGAFGSAGTDNVISCGSYTGNGATAGPTVTLGWEPQFLLIKRSTTAGAEWVIYDDMRGLSVGTGDAVLYPSEDAAEYTTGTDVNPTATGFQLTGGSGTTNLNGATYVYMAIRRPMKPPTVGTSVYTPVYYTGITSTVATPKTNGFSPDMFMSLGYGGIIFDKLRGKANNLKTALTAVDTQQATLTSFDNDGVTLPYDGTFGYTNSGGTDYGYNFFKRAPGFFDIVAWTGNGSARTIAHSLGVAPELIIIKNRTNGGTIAPDWVVRFVTPGSGATLFLNKTDTPSGYYGYIWNNADPTSTGFDLSVDNYMTNSSTGSTYVGYLFATRPKVSKVGSYTGTGALQTINCGFTSGARFIMIKRTDATGSWWTFTSASGIGSGNDPYWLMDGEVAVVKNTNYVDTDSTGFKVTAAAPAGMNAVGGTYSFFAIA
jgi:hypothetical protein